MFLKLKFQGMQYEVFKQKTFVTRADFLDYILTFESMYKLHTDKSFKGQITKYQTLPKKYTMINIICLNIKPKFKSNFITKLQLPSTLNN